MAVRGGFQQPSRHGEEKIIKIMFINTNTKRRDGRDGDIKELKRALTSANPDIRRSARLSAEKIRREGKKIKSMREALIREHRRGNVENVKDIHAHTQKHQSIYLNRL